MAIKVFTLIPGNATKDLAHWQKREQGIYKDNDINLMKDTNGGKTNIEPTSIPSPFARLDLPKTAFDFVAKSGKLNDDTIYHKIVSDCLDIGQIFFNFSQIKIGNLKIITWNKNENLPKPEGDGKSKKEGQNGKENVPQDGQNPSGNIKHDGLKLFKKTLNLFWEQDSSTYNFGDTEVLYFLLFNHKVIGGTSPATMFFTSPNDLSFVNIRFGNDRVFDNIYCPLYQRDPEFQKYMHFLFAANHDLGEKMKEVRNYLNSNLKELETSDNKLYDEIKNKIAEGPDKLKESLSKDYQKIAPNGSEVKVLHVDLLQIGDTNLQNQINSNSGFVINSTKYKEVLTPLVLPCNKYFSKEIDYTIRGSRWESNDFVIKDDRLLAERILPKQAIKYPYLTISDFLEPYLIQLPYAINKEKFFDGNWKNNTNSSQLSYLLPLKKEFFNYFNISDLKEKKFGKNKDLPVFEMGPRPGSIIEVTLRIPIKGEEFIEYKRPYNLEGNSDINNNIGEVIDLRFGLSVFPFFKMEMEKGAVAIPPNKKESSQEKSSEEEMEKGAVANSPNKKESSQEKSSEEEMKKGAVAIHPNYRVSIAVDYQDDKKNIRGIKGKDHDLSFYKKDLSKIEPTKSLRNIDPGDTLGARIFAVNSSDFDFIQLRVRDYCGIIIPNFTPKSEGKSEFTFAIDFGTTNTLIEYMYDQKGPYIFEIPKGNQITYLHASNRELSSAIAGPLYKTQIPEEIGGRSEFKFPQRTSISYDKSHSGNGVLIPLAHTNIPFYFGEETPPDNTEIKTNLKWSDILESSTISKVDYIGPFFEELLLLIKNKVLLNGGKLATTKLICFYPYSMSGNRRNTIREKWNDAFKKYFGEAPPPQHISESIAPFYAVSRKGGIIASSKPALTVDIGGETTDSVIYESNDSKVLTSFRFAANSIFGDGLNSNINRNGFISSYDQEIDSKLKGSNLITIRNEIRESGNSSDLISFYFSLGTNKEISEKRIPIAAFNDYLTNTNLKFKPVFLIFYSAIIYHLARIMRINKLNIPGNIIFSGTGSKVINILGSLGTLNLNEKKDQEKSGEGNGNSEEGKTLGDFTSYIFKKVYEEPNRDELIKLLQPAYPKRLTCEGGLLAEDIKKGDEIDKLKQVIYGGRNESKVKGVKYKDIDDSMKSDVVDEVLHFADILQEIKEEFNYNSNFGINHQNFETAMTILQDRGKIEDYLFLALKLKMKEGEMDSNEQLDETLFFYPLKGVLNEAAFELSKGN